MVVTAKLSMYILLGPSHRCKCLSVEYGLKQASSGAGLFAAAGAGAPDRK